MIPVKLEIDEIWNIPSIKERNPQIIFIEDKLSTIVHELESLGEDGCLSSFGKKLLRKCSSILSRCQHNDESVVEVIPKLNDIFLDFQKEIHS